MIYLVRHGQTQANKSKLYVGRSESELTETGLMQHDAVVDKLIDANIDKMFSSPRKRCVDLCTKIAEHKDLDFAIDNRIEEIDFGIFEGLSYEEAQSKYPKVWQRWVESDGTFTLPGGESTNSFDTRVKEFADELIKSAEDENIFVITHGGIITSLICHLFNQDAENKWRYSVKNGAIVKVKVFNGFAYMVLE